MNNQVKIIITLFFGLTVVYVLPLAIVDAVELESGVTINETSKIETEVICDDTLDNDDGKMNPEDQDCAIALSETEKICDDGKDNDDDGKIDADDQNCVAAPEGQAEVTCAILKILSVVPINYGQLTPGEESTIQTVNIRNEGYGTAKIIVKGGDWISDSADNPLSGPEVTHVGIGPISPNAMVALKSNEFQIGMIPPGNTVPVSFLLKVPASGFTGSLHQEITLDLIC
jgi:hypothetical protein